MQDRDVAISDLTPMRPRRITKDPSRTPSPDIEIGNHGDRYNNRQKKQRAPGVVSFLHPCSKGDDYGKIQDLDEKDISRALIIVPILFFQGSEVFIELRHALILLPIWSIKKRMLPTTKAVKNKCITHLYGESPK